MQYMRQCLDHWTTGPFNPLTDFALTTCIHTQILTPAKCSVTFFEPRSACLSPRLSSFTDLMHMHTKSGCAYSSALCPITLSRPEFLLWLHVCCIGSVNVTWHSVHVPTRKYLCSLVLCAFVCACVNSFWDPHYIFAHSATVLWQVPGLLPKSC